MQLVKRTGGRSRAVRPLAASEDAIIQFSADRLSEADGKSQPPTLPLAFTMPAFSGLQMLLYGAGCIYSGASSRHDPLLPAHAVLSQDIPSAPPHPPSSPNSRRRLA